MNQRKRQYGPKQVNVPENPTEKDILRLEQKAMNSALWHLERGNRTRKQIREKFDRKGFPDTVSETVLDRLEELELINDRKYAFDFVSARARDKGKNFIRMELRRRGITDEDIDDALDTIDREEVSERILELATQHLSSGIKRKDPYKAKQATAAYLARRGFPMDEIFNAVNNAFENLETGE